MLIRSRKLGVGLGLLGLGAFAMAGTAYWAASSSSSSPSSASATTPGASSLASAVASSLAASGGLPADAETEASGPLSQDQYIVVLKDAPLATYDGTLRGLPKPEVKVSADGGVRLDSQGARARQYVDYVEDRQRAVESTIEARLQRPVEPEARMQHAINAIVVSLTPVEAAKVDALADVQFVEPYREYQLDTSTGPALIGAVPVWSGTNPRAVRGLQGEGVVVGILDTGINFGSPSFAAVDPTDGYRHVNPLGAGTYLGTCAPGGVDEGRCNDKLIGGYDFVCNYQTSTACTNPAYREEPGFGDTNSHGSHVAGTAAGNKWNANFRGTTQALSGVAPRANVIAYDICFTNIATGQGSCPNVSAVGAINQAIADGVVDVINYSIGGGASPWSEAVSQAFLAATDAGIYVAASAGNSGPGPNTMGHLQPWVASTAAAQHGRGEFSFTLQVTGPTPVPEPLSPILLTEGSNGLPHTSAIPGTTPLRISPNFTAAAGDGCAPYAAGAFAGAIAVVNRGSCSFAIKANAARTAGAVAVVIANNVPGALGIDLAGAAIRGFAITQSEGNALRSFAATRPNVTAGIGYPPIALPNTPDVLGAFSSRGPAANFDLVKPDVTAPGVSILASIAGTTISGFENAVGLLNGTSMASPHHAGAAALVRQARPKWSVPEIKSALAMTAETAVYNEDSVTPATPFGRGSGRLRVDRAINSGLVLHETTARYLAANPATGGDVSALNQPSMAKRDCFESCSFTRVFRNTTTSVQQYRARVEGLRATLSSNTLRVNPGSTGGLRVTVSTASLPANGAWHFGQLVLEPVNGSEFTGAPTLRLPIAVSVQSPVIKLPASVSLALKQGATGVVSSSIGNVGTGATLDYSPTSAPTARMVAAAHTSLTGSGYYSSYFSSVGLMADDFALQGPARLANVTVQGFVPSGAGFATASPWVLVYVYADNNGVPAGNPFVGSTAPVAFVEFPVNHSAVNVSGDSVSVNLSSMPQLPAGRYWIMVFTEASNNNNRWAWSTAAEGGNSRIAQLTNYSNNTWSIATGIGDMAMTLNAQVDCGAPWLSGMSPAYGHVAAGASQPVQIRLNASGMPVGNHSAYYCVASNDLRTPVAGGVVTMNVAP